MRATILGFLFLSLSIPVLAQQGPGSERPNRGASFRNMDRVGGTIVSIGSDQIVLKPESGENVTVKIGSDTRVRKNRHEAKLSDFKEGDHVMAFGRKGDNNTFAAAMLAGGEMRAFGPGGAPPSIEDMQRMGLGTKFIAGEVKEINDTKLTILRPDGQTQTIDVDENTSFRTGRGGESGTLADIKVGDRVMGRGEMKNGVFVPQTLRVGGMGGHMRPGDKSQMGPPPQQQQPK